MVSNYMSGCHLYLYNIFRGGAREYASLTVLMYIAHIKLKLASILVVIMVGVYKQWNGLPDWHIFGFLHIFGWLN